MKDDRVYLAHIRDALDRVGAYTTAGRDAFFKDARTQDAVVRNLEIVGEAAKPVSDRAKGLAPNVPWRAVAGMRDKLIHDYFGLNLEIFWQVVEREVPPLKRDVEAPLAKAIADQAGTEGVGVATARLVEAAERAAVQALTRRGYARRDLERWLLKRRHAPAVVQEAVERLAGRGLVDDARFAERYAAQRAARGRSDSSGN